MGSWSHEAIKPWEHGQVDAMKPWGYRIIGLWRMVSWSNGATEPLGHAAMGPWSHRTMELWVHGAMGRWNHRTMAPWVHRAIRSENGAPASCIGWDWFLIQCLGQKVRKKLVTFLQPANYASGRQGPYTGPTRHVSGVYAADEWGTLPSLEATGRWNNILLWARIWIIRVIWI